MQQAYDIQAEQVVLGCLLNDNENLMKLDGLRAGDFYEPVHGEIFSAIERKFHGGDIASPVSLKPMFEEHPALESLNGAGYLATLAGGAVGVVSLKHYAKVIRDYAKRRKAIELFQQSIEDLKVAESADDVISNASGECLNLMGDFHSFRMRTFREVSESISTSLEERLPCYSTGIRELDLSMEGGVYKKKTYCFAARPKNGKTMMLSTIAHNLANVGVRVLYIAAEMTSEEIHQRSIARGIGRNSIAFVVNRSDRAFQEKVRDRVGIEPENGFYVDAAGMNFDQLKHCVLSAKARFDIDGFVLDYLQLITGIPKGQTEAAFQSDVAQWIANISRKENLFSIYAAQINREGNIRGSDGIIMAADQVYQLEMNEAKDAAWAKQIVSRYTAMRDIGSENEHLLALDAHGPHFRDLDATQPKYGAIK